jgi:ribonucleoside-diphosphate reductase alpha chain
MSQSFEIFSPFAKHIWNAKYRLFDGVTARDQTVAETWSRVADAAAQFEQAGVRDSWSTQFRDLMADFAFLPAGRILAGAGSGRQVTLFNCFVMGTIGDDMGAIFGHVREAALTMQQGGGIGHDFSSLRPMGALVRGVGADASGPVSFMDVWDAMCRTILSAGQRRGAMMGTMRCDHPDIELFITAKSDARRLRMFNFSVLVTDAFMQAVDADADWPLVFAGKTYRTIRARALWQSIMRATYDYAEPGVIFIDRINAQNNLNYCETIHATNPCGEQPLPDYGACLLGSLNLVRFIDQPWTPHASLATARLAAAAAVAVRFLDNIIDISGYPLEAQRQEALAKRRIGLGITGLADALVMCGLDYRSASARAAAGRWMQIVQNASYRASAALARERGSFALFDADALRERPGIQRLDAETQAAIVQDGLRNGLLTSIAPTGTISLLAGNVSSGIEPIFAVSYRRRLLGADGTSTEIAVEDYAHRLFRATYGDAATLPAAFVTANDLTPSEHLAMQAALQPYVDSSISKTINCPETIAFAEFTGIYREAYQLDLKGCTTFRPNAVTGSILSIEPPAEAAKASPTQTEPAGAPGPLPVRQVTTAAINGLAADHAPLPRDPVLAGFTYKLRWPDSDHAMYVTINDVTIDGQQRPFEIFINSKNLEHYAWTVALTRMISAVFRRGGDVRFVVEELKAVFDPRGGQWMSGRYVPSLLAAIGEVIEGHMRATGFLDLPPSDTAARSINAPSRPPLWVPSSAQEASIDGTVPAETSGWPHQPSVSQATTGRFCPRCNQPAFALMDGCWTCRDCGYSRCS